MCQQQAPSGTLSAQHDVCVKQRVLTVDFWGMLSTLMKSAYWACYSLGRPFNAITERPAAVLMERRCPTSNPGSSEAEGLLIRHIFGGQQPFTGSGLKRWMWRTEKRDDTEQNPGRDAGSLSESEIKPTSLRWGKRPEPPRRRWSKTREGDDRGATAKS